MRSNPKVLIGLCKSTFDTTKDVSRQTNVWCINLNSGDVLSNGRWRQYYNVDENDENIHPFNMTPQKSEMEADFDIKFGINSVIGILVDRQNGFVNFFKDGMDLG